MNLIYTSVYLSSSLCRYVVRPLRSLSYLQLPSSQAWEEEQEEGKMEETKVIYYVDDEETPYLMKIPTSPGSVTLADFKGQLNRSYHKFFFKSVDDDFG